MGGWVVHVYCLLVLKQLNLPLCHPMLCAVAHQQMLTQSSAHACSSVFFIASFPTFSLESNPTPI